MASRFPILRMLWQRCANSSTKSGTHSGFSSSWRSYASKPGCRTRAPPPNPSSNAQPSRTAQGGPKYGQLVRKVAAYGDLVLYRGPSHTLYRFNAFAVAASAFGYAAYHSYINFVDPLMEVENWILYTHGGICVVTSAMGAAWLTRAGNLVKSVAAVQNGSQTLLRFTVQGTRPFSRPREFEVSPRKVAISKKLVVSEERRRVVGENVRTPIAASTEQKPPSLMMAPIRAMNRGVGSWLQALKQLALQEDFIILRVDRENGKRPLELRMDANGYLSSDFFLIGDPVIFKN
ncbi:hypothetical protein N7470_005039 [Penicillium chermesinum]|nr:hypothetical protein N7470_005039 [Penicillium chermesinum]